MTNRRLLLTLVAATALGLLLSAIIRRRRRDRDSGPTPVTGTVHMAVGDAAPEPADPPETAEVEAS